MDYKCDLNCPGGLPPDSPPICCRFCCKSRRYYITTENIHLWSGKYGFWSPSGCRLERDKMPDKCKGFDCKKFRWGHTLEWVDGRWGTRDFGEIKPHQIIKLGEKET